MKDFPFLPRFHDGLRAGRKRLTMRSKRYGRKGDQFNIPGANPPICIELVTDPYPLPLGEVAGKRFIEEDCASPLDFIETWDSLHPRHKFDPALVRYAHEIRAVEGGEKPVVAWNPSQGNLVDQGGVVHTNAQQAKAERYVDLGLIRPSEIMGSPPNHSQVYELAPLPGCRVKNHVTVRWAIQPDWTDGPATYECRCQRAQGTSRTPAAPCSHELAIRMFRKAASKEVPFAH